MAHKSMISLIINGDPVDAIVKDEAGKVFAKCLEHAGVYERSEKGIAAFLRFVDKVNE